MSDNAYPHSPQVAVGAIVVKDHNILLVNRNRPPGRGLWAVPGGRVELGETLQEAVEREVKEETGITVKARDPVYVFDLIDRDDQGAIRFHFVIVDLEADYVRGTPEAGDDASEARWISWEALKGLPVSQSTKDLFRDRGIFPRAALVQGTRIQREKTKNE